MALDETKPAGSDLVSSLDTYGQEARVAINLNTVHKSSDGSDHTFIDQDVTSGAAPTLLGTNITAIPDTGLSSGATVTSAGAGDSGKLVKLDASGVLDSTVIGSSFELVDLGVTTLTVSELLRVNAGGTAVESSGKTVPTGDIVGLSDSQVLTNKTLTSPVLNTGVSGTAVLDEDTMASDSATQLATQQSIKAYVDSGAITMTNKTLTSPVMTTPQINDTSADHQYIFAVSELVADRTVTLPLLGGNDTFVFADFIQTLTNKTLTTPTIGDFTNATHDHTDAAGGGTLTSVVLVTPLIDDTDAGVTLTSADQTHATPVVTIPDIGDAADTFVMNDTTATLTNKTIGSGTYESAQGYANASTPGAVKTDGFYMWSADIVAGNAAPHFLTEDNSTIKLYQVSSADQADQGAMTTIGANTGTSGVGLSLIGDTSTVNQATNLMNDLAALQEDIAALDTVVTAIRSALIAHGLIKGSA